MSRFNTEVNVAILAAFVTLSLAIGLSTPNRVEAGAVVEDLVGVWTGFVQAGEGPAEAIVTEVLEQEERRFVGVVSDPSGPHVIEGTVSASGKVNYQSKSPDVHLVGKHDLLSFDGGAAILNGDLTRPSVDGKFIVPCVLVMRPFAAADGSVIPNVAGLYSGAFSDDDSGIGQISLELFGPRDSNLPTSFGGEIVITLNGEVHELSLLGTVNGDGRIIGIAHKSGPGHMTLDAVIDPSTQTITGTFKLELEHGVEIEGSFEAPVSRSTAS